MFPLYSGRPHCQRVPCGRVSSGNFCRRSSVIAKVAETLLAPFACCTGFLTGGNAPFIPVTIAGSEFVALLETGASASSFNEEVLSHLHKHSVRLRDCRTTFNLAKGVAHSAGAARLTFRWGDRVRRTRFIHLPWLSVPVILGRDFFLKTGIPVDIMNGGYSKATFSPLKPFIGVGTLVPAAITRLLGLHCRAAPPTLSSLRASLHRRHCVKPSKLFELWSEVWARATVAR